jgi:hypothetical protein
MNKPIAFALLSIFIISCDLRDNTEYLSDSEIEQLSNEIPKEIIINISKECRTNPVAMTVNRMKYDVDTNTAFVQYDSLVPGIQFKFISDELARQLWNEFHDEVSQYGYYLYLKNLDYDKKWNVYYDIAIVKTHNQFDLLKLVKTSAPNNKPGNLQIISKLKEWNAQSSFQLIVADNDRIEAVFLDFPSDTKSFCMAVDSFSPNVINNGYGSLEDMIMDFTSKQYFWMWWK